jgi:hypothetical protein
MDYSKVFRLSQNLPLSKRRIQTKPYSTRRFDGAFDIRHINDDSQPWRPFVLASLLTAGPGGSRSIIQADSWHISHLSPNNTGISRNSVAILKKYKR